MSCVAKYSLQRKTDADREREREREREKREKEMKKWKDGED